MSHFVRINEAAEIARTDSDYLHKLVRRQELPVESKNSCIWELKASGKTVRQIASELRVGVGTVARAIKIFK